MTVAALLKSRSIFGLYVARYSLFESGDVINFRRLCFSVTRGETAARFVPRIMTPGRGEKRVHPTYPSNEDAARAEHPAPQQQPAPASEKQPA